jgi:type I restriction enzyme, S subunit
MKAGWSLATIGDVCDVVNGGTPKTGVLEYWGGQHQWITPAEMGKRSTPYVSQTERTITDQGLQNSSARPLPPMSVILSSRAPIGHLVINTEPMATNQGCKGLIPRKQIDHKFLYYYLGSIVDLLNDLGTGATFKELSGGKLKEVPVPLPPLPEQQRIVTLLDEAFDGIATAKANAERNLQNARAIFESHLQSAFLGVHDGWVRLPVAECFKVRSGDFLPAKSMAEGGIPVYGGNGIAGFHNTGNLSGDQVVIGRVGAKCGNVRYVNHDIWLTDNAFHISQYFRPFNPAFLARLLNFKDLRQTANQAAQPVISYTTIKDVSLCFPTRVEEQAAINARFDELEEQVKSLESIYQQKLTALDELKKSVLHRAFNGKL